MRNKFPAFLFWAAGLATPLAAGVIPIVNASFEANVLPCAASVINGGTCNVTSVTGWTATALGGGTLNGGLLSDPTFGTAKPSTADFSSIPDGVNTAYLQSKTYGVSLSQVLNVNLAANDTYTLTFYTGIPASYPSTIYGTAIQLEAGGNYMTSSTGPVTQTQLNAAVPTGSFTELTYTFTTGANPIGLGDPLSLVISMPGSGSIYEVTTEEFDDFSLSDKLGTAPASAPEPATLATLGSGLVFVSCWSRHRRRAKIS